MRFGVLIVSYHVRDLLAACLTSVFAEAERMPDSEIQVVVVDNASADGSADMVAVQFPQVRLIRSQENLGFAGGNNLGFRALGCDEQTEPAQCPDYILLLNPDAELQTGALQTLGDFLEMHPHTGGCCPRLNYGDGGFQHSAFHFPGLTQLLLDFFPLHPRLLNSRLNGRYSRHLYESGAPFAIDFALGACLLVRAEVVRAAGLLDEGYFMYVEELDWQRRMRAAGWPMFCVPAAHVMHHEGQSARQFRGAMTVALWRSRLRYYDRFYPLWKRRLARRLVRLGMRTEAHRARVAHADGRIDEAELSARLDAYAQISAMTSSSQIL